MSHKALRKQLRFSDQTILECFNILQTIGLFSRIRRFSPERGHFSYTYFYGSHTERAMKEALHDEKVIDRMMEDL